MAEPRTRIVVEAVGMAIAVALIFLGIALAPSCREVPAVRIGGALLLGGC